MHVQASGSVLEQPLPLHLGAPIRDVLPVLPGRRWLNESGIFK
jgi:hypothetical protein